MMVLRGFNLHSDSEISHVTHRMPQTMIEVLGEEKGSSMYSIDWPIDRVRWHLDSNKSDGYHITTSQSEMVQLTKNL